MMSWRQELIYVLRRLRRRRTEQELEEEIQTHLELEIKENIEAGMAPEEARYAALRAFGSVALAKEGSRAMWGFKSLEMLLQDLRYGLRVLCKNPGFTTAAVLTLALGIGANTSTFTFLNAFVFRPIPVADPASIINIYGAARDGSRQNLFSYADYLDYRDRNDVFSGLVAWNKCAVTLGDVPPGPAANDDSMLAAGYEYAFGLIVSENYFSVLGARIVLGRAFLPEEDRTPGAYPVVVLSHRFWHRHFNSDPGLVGKSIKLQGHQFTVVGITAPEFVGTDPRVPDFWTPLMMRDLVVRSWLRESWLRDRNANSLSLLGRLRPGVSLEQAQAEMTAIARQLAADYPAENSKSGVLVKPGASFFALDDFLQLIVPTMLAVALVLLIACANVANLLLARSTARRREIAVRLALGASRGRLVRQLLTESVLISVLGGATGLLLSLWTIELLYPVVVSSLPLPSGFTEAFAFDLNPDLRVFGYTFLLSLLTGVFFGLAPALQSSRPDLATALKDEGTVFGRRRGRSRLRDSLVVIQVAVSLVLLTSAGLLIRSIQKLQTIDTGLQTDRVVSLAVGSGSQVKDHRREVELRREFVERLTAMPGIQSVSLALKQPLTGFPPRTEVMIEGEAPEHSLDSNGHALTAYYNEISPGYFETLGLRVLKGRGFTEQEVKSGAPLLLVSASTARKFWPGEDPLGKRLTVGTPTGAGGHASELYLRSAEVIGVTADTRSGWIWKPDETYLYLPANLDNQSDMYVVAKIAGDGDLRAGDLTAAVRREAEDLDQDLRVSVRRINDSLDYQMAPFRACALFATGLGLMALLLASVGLYGVMAYAVSRRTHEIGIRMALGAGSRDVLKLVFREGMRVVVAGMIFGLAGSAVASRVLKSVLIDVSPLDPIAYSCVSLALAAVAMVAIYVPARRATKVNPVIALRYE